MGIICKTKFNQKASKMLYQAFQNPIFPNQKSCHNWGLIDSCSKDEIEIEYYEAFLDSDLESVESDSEYYSENDEFQDFPELDATNPTISIVEIVDSDLQSESNSDVEFRNHEKNPSLMTI